MPHAMWQHSQLEQRIVTWCYGGAGCKQWVVHASFGAVQASTWRTAEVVDGRSYGRVPEASLGGAAAAARVRGCELAHAV